MLKPRVPKWQNHTKSVRYAGVHIVADFWFSKGITSESTLKRLLLQAAKQAKSTPLEISVHRFRPQGLTGVLLIAESHLAIHTWPEIGYIALDIFTCGKHVQPRKALEFLRKELSPKRVFIQEFVRGKMP